MFVTGTLVELEEGGRFDMMIPLPRPIADDHCSAFVLVERVVESGEAPAEAGFTAELPGVKPLATELRTMQLFAGSVSDDLDALMLSVVAQVRGRFRIFVGWASRRLREAWAKLRCPGCRMALKAALKAGLGMLGVPLPEGGEVMIDSVDRLLDALLQSEIAEFLSDLLGEHALDALRDAVHGAFDPVSKALRLLDELFFAICARLGLCP